MISSAGRFLSGVIGFLVLLKRLSHSADMDAATERLVLRCPTKIWGLKVLGGRSDVSSDPYTLKAFRLTVRFLGPKRREKWKEIPSGRPFAHYLGKGEAMTRAYGYIYTIFGLEASHTSLSEQALR
jgi:hypothetical protein